MFEVAAVLAASNPLAVLFDVSNHLSHNPFAHLSHLLKINRLKREDGALESDPATGVDVMETPPGCGTWKSP